MGLKKVITIQQALQNVADHPELDTDELISLPVHELVCRTLFEIANNVRPHTQSKANTARQIIFNRLVGRRAPGAHPATRQKNAISFVDLTGELER